jgi:hypothetical protein
MSNPQFPEIMKRRASIFRVGWIGLLLGLPLLLPAQTLDREVIAAEGEQLTSGALQIEYTVGEPMISTGTAGAFILTEGFLQPDHMAADSVWPGDANSDGIANNVDLLAIGVGYGSTGPQRPGASLTWKPQYAPAWSDTLITGTNYNHLDTDGNGTVNFSDTTAISLNYGLTHNKTSSAASQGPLLGVIFSQDSLMAGDTAVLIVFLGQDTLPADSVYGVAFSINYDSELVDAGNIFVEYDSSWLGNYGADMLAMSWNFPVDGKIDMAITRTDLQNRNGFGEIARLCIIMIDDISGKTFLQELFYASTSDPLVISRDESVIGVTVGDDSLLVYQEDSTTSTSRLLSTGMELYPNPAQDQLHIQLQDITGTGWAVFNVLGEEVMRRETAFREASIDTRRLAEGLYTISVFTSKGTLSRKVQVIR